MSVSILVVDDETDVASLFRQHFRREARQGTYVLHFAYSGEEALEKLCTGIEPQLRVILSDINMPVMDGLGCCGRSRRGGLICPWPSPAPRRCERRQAAGRLGKTKLWQVAA
jgi:CheY-like chemotaxis protein